MQEPTPFEFKKRTRNKPFLLSWYHHAVLILLGLTILSYCSPLRISFPIRGKIVDSETRKPVDGAVVRLSREAICTRMIHGSDRYQMPTLEATTDSDGNFRIGGIWGAAPCLASGWLYSLTIAAVGYIPDFTDNETDDWLAGPLVVGTYQLRPIRFWLENLNLYEQFKVPASDNSAFGKTVKTAIAADTYDATPSGVHASVKDARLDFIVVKSDLIPNIVRQGRWQRNIAIIARDKVRNRFYAWDSFGKEIPFDKRNVSSALSLESYVQRLVASGVEPSHPTKCETADGFIVKVSRDSGTRSLVALAPQKYQFDSQTEPIELPPHIAATEIVACAGAANFVYLALKDEAILRVEVTTPRYKTFKPKVTAFVELREFRYLNANSMAILSLDYHRIGTELGFEVVYMVANDENIYRFNSRLAPDHRIQFVK